MTFSPFTPFSNATLIFQVDSGALSQDNLGNVVPIQQKVTVTAALELAKLQSSSRQLFRPEGVPSTAVRLTGFLASPLSTVQQKSTFERFVTEFSRCAATIDGVPGQFWLDPFVHDPYQRAVGVFIASEIAGWFARGASVVIVGDEAV